MHLRRLIAQKLSSEQAENIINAVIDRVKNTCSPDRVYLFGSAAEKQMTDQSDVDILMVFPNNEILKASKMRFYRYPQKIIWPVDAIFVTDEYFEKQSKIGGICQYCLEKGQRILWNRNQDK